MPQSIGKSLNRWVSIVLAIGFCSACFSQSIESDWQRDMLVADSLKNKGDVQQSLALYFMALRKVESDSNYWGIAVIAERLGDLHEKYYRYEESIPYLKRSYSILSKMDSIGFRATVANSIAWNYIKINLPDSALRYSEESVQLFSAWRAHDILNYCIALESLGEIYSKKSRYEDATRVLDLCLELGAKANQVVVVGFTHYGIALNHFNQRKMVMAQNHIEQCLPVAEQYASGELLADVYKLAYEIYNANTIASKSFQYLEKYSLLKDKLHSEDIEKKSAIVNANYELQKREDDLSMSHQRNAIQQLEIQQQHFTRNILIATVIIILVIGALIYGRIQNRRKFERQELERKKEEMEQARKVQLSLLPKNAMMDDSFMVMGKMVTATEVGGDYFDFVKLDENRVLIAFGDATGHGMAAGMLVTIVKVALINNLALLRDDNNVVPLAKAIHESILATISVKGIGMALQLCVMDKRMNTVSLTSCGMPYPIVLDNETKKLEVLEIRQPPLGFFKNTKITLTEIDFDSNKKMFLVSDGILERFNAAKEEYGMERLSQVIQAAPEQMGFAALIDAIFMATDTFAQGVANHDDMTMLVAALK